MKKKVKTQNGKQQPGSGYKGHIMTIHYLDGHIAALTESRNMQVKKIKKEFHKSSENIEFELNKLKGK